MKEFVYYGELFNIYSFLLTKKQQEIFKLYYCENYSLSEIADYKKVSRSYIGKVINDVQKKLVFFESNLHCLEMNNKTTNT